MSWGRFRSSSGWRHRGRLRPPRRHVPHRAQLHESAAADGGHRDDRDRSRLRAPDRRDRPLGRLRQRGRRGRDDAAPAPRRPWWPWWLAILAALLITTAIGFVQALVITKAGVPSFVVTLAGLLIWSGVVLILTTQASSIGTIRIQDETVVRIANDFLSRHRRLGSRSRGVIALRARAAQHRAPAACQRPVRRSHSR